MASAEIHILEATAAFQGVACTSSPHAGACQPSGDLFAYAGSRYVLLMRIQNGASYISASLHGHSDRVNCVAWLDNDVIVSGSSDHSVKLWSASEQRELSSMDTHKGSVVALHAMKLSSGQHVVLSCSADHTICISFFAQDFSVQSVQQHNLGNAYGLCIAACELPLQGKESSSTVLLTAVGTSDSKVHMFTSTVSTEGMDGNAPFLKVDTLVEAEDWVRSLAFTQHDSDVILATACQDAFIRLYRISPDTEEDTPEQGFLARLEASRRKFSVKLGDHVLSYAVRMDALLIGHESKVFGVQWAPSAATPTLLSASADKTVILWCQDEASGVWTEESRLGEVGGNTLGFMGACFQADGGGVLSHSLQGALHHWRNDSGVWTSLPVASGHFSGVRSLCWEQSGAYLLSVSDDQTCRLFAPWAAASSSATWHEMARPQVHGYDMRCVAMLGALTYVSGADEKVLRVFQAPESFVTSFRNLTNVHLSDALIKEQVFGASVPALGLSNKAVGDDQSERSLEEFSGYRTNEDKTLPSVPSVLQAPPVEDHLIQNTLWPETQKLYGHGYELVAVAATSNGSMIATSCKATNEEHAVIRLWSSDSWTEIATLAGHRLSVAKLAFSHNDMYLASCSKDRSIHIFKQTTDAYEPFAAVDKAHDRIIWDLAWAADDSFLLSGARDKMIKSWGVAEQGVSLLASMKQHESVTSVACIPCNRLESGTQLVAAGFDDGSIKLFAATSSTIKLVYDLPAVLCHQLTVTCVRFRPQHKDAEDSSIQLASCSSDSMVRVINITLATY